MARGQTTYNDRGRAALAREVGVLGIRGIDSHEASFDRPPKPVWDAEASSAWGAARALRGAPAAPHDAGATRDPRGARQHAQHAQHAPGRPRPARWAARRVVGTADRVLAALVGPNPSSVQTDTGGLQSDCGQASKGDQARTCLYASTSHPIVVLLISHRLLL